MMNYKDSNLYQVISRLRCIREFFDYCYDDFGEKDSRFGDIISGLEDPENIQSSILSLIELAAEKNVLLNNEDFNNLIQIIADDCSDITLLNSSLYLVYISIEKRSKKFEMVIPDDFFSIISYRFPNPYAMLVLSSFFQYDNRPIPNFLKSSMKGTSNFCLKMIALILPNSIYCESALKLLISVIQWKYFIHKMYSLFQHLIEVAPSLEKNQCLALDAISLMIENSKSMSEELISLATSYNLFSKCRYDVYCVRTLFKLMKNLSYEVAGFISFIIENDLLYLFDYAIQMEDDQVLRNLALILYNCICEKQEDSIEVFVNFGIIQKLMMLYQKTTFITWNSILSFICLCISDGNLSQIERILCTEFFNSLMETIRNIDSNDETINDSMKALSRILDDFDHLENYIGNTEINQIIRELYWDVNMNHQKKIDRLYSYIHGDIETF